MATLLDLFKENKTNLYSSLPSQVPTSKTGKPITPKVIGSKNSEIIIESKGLLNPARKAAVLVAQPTQLGDIITNNAAGLLTGWTAKRPSDTIFFFRKIGPPVSINPLVGRGLGGIDSDRAYFVKTRSIPMVSLGNLIGGAANAAGAAVDAVRSAITAFKNSPTIGKGLNPETPAGEKMKTKPRDRKAAIRRGHGLKYFGPTPGGGDKNGKLYTGANGRHDRSLESPLNAQTNQLYSKLNKMTYKSDDNFISEVETNNELYTGQTYIRIGVVTTIESGIRNFYNMVFPATVTSISEDVSPEWNSFRYLGSPFKVHRYSGVERSLKFDFKLYYTTELEKGIMINKLNSLKELAFPYAKISEVKYGNDAQATQYAFTPNLITLTISGLYNKILGFVDSLSFSIDDNVSWGSGMYSKNDKEKGLKDRPYPTVINVSFSMKIIENQTIEDNIYQYSFDGIEKIQDEVTPASLIERAAASVIGESAEDKFKENKNLTVSYKSIKGIKAKY